MIGRQDLSLSLGLPERYHDPRFENVVQDIISRARERGLSVGIHFSQEAELQIKWAQAGANVIMHSSDMALFQQRLQDDLKTIRHHLGEEDGTAKDEPDSHVI